MEVVEEHLVTLAATGWLPPEDSLLVVAVVVAEQEIPVTEERVEMGLMDLVVVVEVHVDLTLPLGLED